MRGFWKLMLAGIMLAILFGIPGFVKCSYAETYVTDKVEIIKSRMMFNRSTSQNYLDVSVKNISDDVLLTPIKVVIDSISSADVTVANADGMTDDGKPYFEYTTDTGQFLADEETESKVWYFDNPNRARFSYTTVIYASVLEVAAVKVGNPVLYRFPNSGDPENSRPRSIWDMHFFNNKIYIGHGDYWANSGATDLWVYDGINFVNEYTVDDEMIFDFFEFENKLFIPGNDATEDWTFGNLYINDFSDSSSEYEWVKRRTLPGAVHVFDVALFKNTLYASITTDGSTPARTLFSNDMGETWTDFLSDEYCHFVVFDDFMFLMSSNVTYDEETGYYSNIITYYTYDGDNLQVVTPNLFIYMPGDSRCVRFNDGVLYSNPVRYMLENSPLYFISSDEIINNGTAINISHFTTKNVRDILVRNEICYVMTATEVVQDIEYKGFIYSSSNLEDWSLVAEFALPGIPLSFELMNNSFYIGLGVRYEPDLGWDEGCIGSESGSIYKVPLAEEDGNYQ